MRSENVRVSGLVFGCLAVSVATGLRAQAVPDTAAARKPVPKLDTLVATGRVNDLVGIAVSSNQGSIVAADLALRPLLRTGELVENIPGLIVTQHGGSGKANQYFLRGFNLDHGTDLALSVDGVPVNMPSHAHGQGYADLNFLIPELVERVDFKKGPYYADVGDFGSAGAFDVRYFDRLPAGLFRAEGGQLGYGRALVADNIGAGKLMYAGEFEHDDGPWTQGDNERKYDGLLRYTRGNEHQGFTLTAMGYHNDWRSTDQVPDRAIADGLITRFGDIDPTDAGRTGRYSLTADWRAQGASSNSHATAYAIRYDLDLFSDFTYFLNDPVHGDQIEQQDGRFVFGGTANHNWVATLFGAPSQYTVGVDARNDDIDNGLYHTEAQRRLSATDVNHVVETSVAPYVENRTYWNSWFRSVVGLRGDAFWFAVHNVAGGSSGNEQASLLSPKISLVVGPWARTEFYVDAGSGFHSNDARGVVAAAVPATPLARSKGGEIGVRSGLIPGLQTSVSLWLLDLTSELVWSGDDGTNEPSGPTRRYGVELANFYTPVRWLTLDADYAWSHARYTDNEASGDFVPEALVSTFDGGVALHNLAGGLRHLRAGVRLRYFGPRPLTQDNSVRSPATSLVYANAGYDVSEMWNIGLSVFNLFDTRASDIDYYYTSRLPGEPLSGVNDIHTHAAEPRSVRLSITARLGSAHLRQY
jgi:TonB dependent receptor/TonB-dependent Receptor Plug Domain